MNRIIAIAFVFSVIYFIFPLSASAQVVINEFQVSPDDWIELYNKSNDTVDISGLIIDDSGGTEKYTVPAGTTLQPKKCISFQSGNFNWNSSDDDIRLLDSLNNLVEVYHYGNGPGDNVSIGRAVDGEGSLEILTFGSRDKYNVSDEICLQPTPSPSPTPTLTPAQTATTALTSVPTVTPTKTPTTAPTKSPTPKPTATSGESKPTPEESSVLGETATSGTPHTSGEPELTPEVKPEKKKLPFLPIIFIGSGVLMISFAVYNLVRAGKSTI